VPDGQWCGINILFNYAQEVYRGAGYGINGVFFNIIVTGSINLAPVIWVLIAEIFPNRVRGLGVAAFVSTLWAASFVLIYTFPLIRNAIGISGAFLVYSAVCFLWALLVFLSIPETKERPLEEMEAIFTGARNAPSLPARR